MGWSCAAATRELRQVGNEATVSGARRVPQGYRAGASGRRVAGGGRSKVGARPSFKYQERRGDHLPRRSSIFGAMSPSTPFADVRIATSADGYDYSSPT